MGQVRIIRITKEPIPGTFPDFGYLAAANPIQYSLQRCDYLFDEIEDDGSDKVRLIYESGNVSLQFPVGKNIMIKAGNSYDYVEGEVTAVSFSGGDTIVTTDIDYTSAISSGDIIVNLADVTPDFFFYVKAQGRVFKIWPDIQGRATVDVGEIYRSKLKYLDPDMRSWTTINNLNPQLSTFETAPVLTGFPAITVESSYADGEADTESSVLIYAVKAARQIFDRHRNNMKLYTAEGDFGYIVVDDSAWTQENAGQDWQYDTENYATLNTQMSSKELEFVKGYLKPAGEWYYAFLVQADQLGGDEQIMRLLFYDIDKLVHVKEITIAGSAGDPLSSTTISGFTDVPFEFDKVRVQLFNPGIFDTIEFRINQSVSFGRLQKPLTLFDKPVVWRNWPFKFSFLFPTSAFDITLISKNLDGANAVLDTRESEPFNNGPTDVASADVPAITHIDIFTGDRDPDIAYIHPDTKTIQMYLKTISIQNSSTWIFEVRDPCANGVMIMWRNSVGGISQWMFAYNQESSYRYDDGRKVRTLILFEDNVTPSQWEAINDMNRPKPVVELRTDDFSTQNKTHTQDGASTFIVQRNGDLTGVIVLPQEIPYNTRDLKRSIRIIVELPTLYTT